MANDPDIQTIMDAALRLPEAERWVLTTRLLDTLHGSGLLSEDDAELEAELIRRSDDLEGAVPWETLRDQL